MYDVVGKGGERHGWLVHKEPDGIVRRGQNCWGAGYCRSSVRQRGDGASCYSNREK